MPNCYTLTRRTDLAAGPVSLQQIDREMCAYFGVPCDPIQWHHYWHNIIGLSLACGQSLEQQIVTILQGEDDDWAKHQLEILVWLKDNFVSDAFYQSR